MNKENMEKIKVGIVGSGFAASFHARAFQRCAEVEIVAASARNEEKLKNYCKEFNIPRYYTDYKEMLEKEEMQMVTVCVPTNLHCDVVLHAAEMGHHIVCEKPLAPTLEECDKMIDACEENNVKLMYAEDWNFAPCMIRAKEIYKEGAIGDIVYIKARESHSGSHSPYAQGTMIHMGIHPIGFVAWFKEKSVKEVIGKTSLGGEHNLIHKNLKGEDWAVGVLTFEDNTFGFVEADYTTYGGMDHRVEVFGTKGNIRINFTQGSPIKVFSSVGYEYAVEKAETTKGWTFPAVEEEHALGYWNQTRYFVDCVKYDKEIMLGARGIDGRDALEAVLAVYESTENDKSVKLKGK